MSGASQATGGYAQRCERAREAVRRTARASGRGTLEVELGEGATVGDVWPALGLGDEPAGIALRA